MKTNSEYLGKNRERLVTEYFLNVKRKMGIISFIIFALLVVATVIFRKPNQMTAHLILAGLAIVALLVFLLSLLGAFSKKLTDLDVAEIFEEDAKDSFEEVFPILAIENNKKDFVTNPLEISCPTTYEGKKTVLFRYNKRLEKLVYSHEEHTVLLFGFDTLFIRKYDFNHLTGLKENDFATEVSYRDITNITTQVKVVGGRNKFECVEVIFGLANGNEISFTIRYNLLKYSKSRSLSEKEIEVVNKIRKTIRENK